MGGAPNLSFRCKSRAAPSATQIRIINTQSKC